MSPYEIQQRCNQIAQNAQTFAELSKHPQDRRPPANGGPRDEDKPRIVAALLQDMEALRPVLEAQQ